MITNRQLLALGLTRHAIAHRLAAERLVPLHRGVYLVGHPPLSDGERWMAAVLACGHSALLGHRSAGALWEIRATRTTLCDVTVVTAAGRSPRRGIIVRRRPQLAPTDVAVHRGIPVTSPERTVLDLATIVSQRELERVIDEAVSKRRCTETTLTETATIAGAAWGASRLRRVLGSHSAGSTLTRSDLEERFLALCRRHGIPAPRVNFPQFGLELDFYWPRERLVVETDGHEHHGTRAAFERDRARDQRLVADGLRVLRFTYRQVVADPARVAHVLERVLATHGRAAG